MPKPRVWLVENTALSFDQIAYLHLHRGGKGIADGDAARDKGLDPVQSQLPRADRSAEATGIQAQAHDQVRCRSREQKGRAHPVSRGRTPNAILWLVRNHRTQDSQIMRLVGTTKSTISRSASAPLECAESAA